MDSRSSVSVIIPAFGRHCCMGEAVRSVLAQTYPAQEIIVVDDGSDPPLALPGFARNSAVQIIRRETNRGAAAARNTGARKARGAWLAFLDSDDIWHPSKLVRQMQVAGQIGRGDVMALATGWRDVERRTVTGRRIPVSGHDLLKFAAGCWFSPGSTLLIRRDVYWRVGAQDESLSRLEDYDWFLRFARMGGRVEVIEECLVDVHRSNSATAENVTHAVSVLMNKYFSPGGELVGMEESVQRRVRAYLHLNIAAAALRSGKPVTGGAALLRSVYWSPRLSLQIERFWRTPCQEAGC